MSRFANERKTLKINKTLILHFLSLFPAGPHPLFILPAYLHALYVKGWVRTPVKVKKAQVYSKKTHFGLILDVSRRNFDVDCSLQGGSCIPKEKELIP